jgi:hypothetical protein
MGTTKAQRKIYEQIRNRQITLLTLFTNHNRIEDGKQVIDEQCRCNHLRSEHNDRMGIGHGNCTQCECNQFTWVKSVTI